MLSPLVESIKLRFCLIHRKSSSSNKVMLLPFTQIHTCIISKTQTRKRCLSNWLLLNIPYWNDAVIESNALKITFQNIQEKNTRKHKDYESAQYGNLGSLWYQVQKRTFTWYFLFSAHCNSSLSYIECIFQQFSGTQMIHFIKLCSYERVSLASCKTLRSVAFWKRFCSYRLKLRCFSKDAYGLFRPLCFVLFL